MASRRFLALVGLPLAFGQLFPVRGGDGNLKFAVRPASARLPTESARGRRTTTAAASRRSAAPASEKASLVVSRRAAGQLRSQRLGRPLVSVFYRALIQMGITVLDGTKDPRHMDEDVGVVAGGGFELPAADVAAVEALLGAGGVGYGGRDSAN